LSTDLTKWRPIGTAQLFEPMGHCERASAACPAAYRWRCTGRLHGWASDCWWRGRQL